MNVDILIRSYHKDFRWLHHSLKSISQYSSGFSNIHIVVPETDVHLISHLTCEKVHSTVDNCDGYLGQQITKLYADTWCKGDYVLHVDSDCIFYKDFSPECFFIDGKPVLLREKCVDSPWNVISEKTLGWYDEYEYMRRHPTIYPTWLYAKFREWIKETHGCELDHWISTRDRHEFSEFNTMGQWAYKFYRDSFVWCHPAEFTEYCKQYWSWGGLDDSIISEIDGLLKK
jgi:hypothetical protein